MHGNLVNNRNLIINFEPLVQMSSEKIGSIFPYACSLFLTDKHQLFVNLLISSCSSYSAFSHPTLSLFYLNHSLQHMIKVRLFFFSAWWVVLAIFSLSLSEDHKIDSNRRKTSYKVKKASRIGKTETDQRVYLIKRSASGEGKASISKGTQWKQEDYLNCLKMITSDKYC